MRTTLLSLSAVAICTIPCIAGGMERNRNDYLPGAIVLLALFLLVACLCYIIHRLDKPIMFEGKKYYRPCYFQAHNDISTEEILDAIIKCKVRIELSNCNVLCLCDEDMEKLLDEIGEEQ